MMNKIILVSGGSSYFIQLSYEIRYNVTVFCNFSLGLKENINKKYLFE